jgi:hypothetical protein
MVHLGERGRPVVVGNVVAPDGRPDAAHVAAGFDRSAFRPLDPEERAAYRKWRRSVLTFYGVCALALAGAAATRGLPSAASSTAETGGARSTITVASQHHALD